MMKSKSSPFAYHKSSTISYAVSYLSTNRVALSSRPGHVPTMPYWIGALVTTAGLIILLVQFCRLLIAYNNFSFLTAGGQESIFEEKRSVEKLGNAVTIVYIFTGYSKCNLVDFLNFKFNDRSVGTLLKAYPYIAVNPRPDNFCLGKLRR